MVQRTLLLAPSHWGFSLKAGSAGPILPFLALDSRSVLLYASQAGPTSRGGGGGSVEHQVLQSLLSSPSLLSFSAPARFHPPLSL